MGLETVHPQALPRLGKRMTVADFDRAAGALAARGIALRAFVLVGAPFVPPAEARGGRSGPLSMRSTAAPNRWR